MISRRQMFQMAGALGAMSVLPRTLAAGTVMPGGGSEKPERIEATSSNDILDYLEAVEDLQDDVDCVELVGRYIQLAPGRDLNSIYWGECPFCKNSGGSRDRLLVRAERVHCMSCDLYCSGDKWFALVEKVSLYEAVRRLRGMLDRGELRGRRKCFETHRAILEDIAGIAHANLLKCSAEFQSMELLKELTEETIRRFHIGVVPGSMVTSIIRQMEGKGWSAPELASANLFELRLVAKRPQASVITLPIRNEHGRVLALVGAYVGRGHSRERSYNPTENYSVHRYSRLVFQYLDRGSKIQEEDRLLLVDDPWDAILMGQQGIAPVVAPLGEWDGENLRRIRSLNARFVYAASVDVLWSEDFMSLLSLLGSDAARLDIAMLPKGMTATHYFRKHGAQALHARLESAVPVSQVLKT